MIEKNSIFLEINPAYLSFSRSKLSLIIRGAEKILLEGGGAERILVEGGGAERMLLEGGGARRILVDGGGAGRMLVEGGGTGRILVEGGGNEIGDFVALFCFSEEYTRILWLNKLFKYQMWITKTTPCTKH